MFENISNSKKQGTIGVAAAILYFTSKNYTVSIPLNDSQAYDLVVDIDNILYSVEVKTTRYINTSNNYVVTLRSKGGTKGTTYGTIKHNCVDYLFVLTDSNKKYLIPCTDFSNTNAITLSAVYDKYLV